MLNFKSKMGNFFKRALVLSLVVALISPNLLSSIAQAAAKTPKLSITKTTEIFVGKKLNINVNNKIKGSKYTWTSGNNKVATVNKNGVVTGIKAGNTTITCFIEAPKETYTLKAKVKIVQGAKSLEISNKKTAKKILVGDTLTLKTVTKPAKVSDKITWTSADSKIAKINKKGKITAVKVGKVKLTAKTASGKKATVTVNVVNTVTVSTQKELNKALSKKNLSKITVKTNDSVVLTIPSGGTYSDTKLVINAPNADIINEGSLFKNIRIDAIKASTFTEKGKGNTFNLRAPASRLVIATGASVKNISLRGEKAEIIVEGAVSGKITFIAGTAIAPELKLSGSSSAVINVVINRPGAKLISSIKVAINMNADAELTFNEGSEGSTVVKSDASIKETIHNNTNVKIDVTVSEDNKQPQEGTTSNNIVPSPGGNNNNNNNNNGSNDPTAPSDTGTDVTIANATSKQAAPFYLDSKGGDYEGLKLVAESFAGDVNLITGLSTPIYTNSSQLKGTVIIAGSIGNNQIIDKLITDGKIDVSKVKDKWEVYQIDVVYNPIAGVNKAVVITGSDKRGTIYGIYHISELMGVSPWAYWGDVAPEKKSLVRFKDGDFTITSKEPSVKYRGIFLNDEAPSLDGWAKNKFGDFNEKFYDHVFELILRLKGNYLWPAMWSAMFNVNGEAEPLASAKLADTYGIVMGTSHHEPMMRAGSEWGKVKNNYGGKDWVEAAKAGDLHDFWDDSVKERGKFENLITLGIRGEADTMMLGEGSKVEDNVNLLKELITDQKQILADNNLADAPKILTIYKEVEEFWHGKDGVPGLKDWDALDDVTIMLAEDNNGNLRTLPEDSNRDREAGWGMYYHFDYVGGPKTYMWVNTVPLTKVWEQMGMAYDYGVDRIWIVNVGDLKPMELPISYFLDMAYDFDKYGSSNLNSASEYTEQWVKQQFGKYTNEEGLNNIKDILDEYTRINGIRKPEGVFSSTYSIANYNEAMTMLKRVNDLITLADDMKAKIPEAAQAAYYQLVYYPAVASANVTKMQIYSGLNLYYLEQGRTATNIYGFLVNQSIKYDQELQDTYNKDMPGVGDKWKYMMSSPHVGYSSWDSASGSYPTPRMIDIASDSTMAVGVQGVDEVYSTGSVTVPDFTSTNKEIYYVDIANTGGGSFDYTISKDADWITITKTSGTVISQDTFGVSVDYNKVTVESTGTVTITSDTGTVTLNIKATVTDVSSLDANTFVEEHGYVSIEAAHFANKENGTGGESWKEIKDYGKTLSSMKVFPNRKTFNDSAEAPYLEYKVYVKEAGKYKLNTYIAPSNNVEWGILQMRYGVQVGESDVIEVNSIPSNFIAGNSNVWSNSILNNIRITTSEHSLIAGVNTIRIYAVDPALVLQKLVLYKETPGLKTSYFGPPESYYVGKDVKSELIADIQEQCYMIPGVISANNMTAKALVTKDGDFEVAFNVSSAGASKIEVLWNGSLVGSITTNGAGTYYLPSDITLKSGIGELSYKAIEGNPTVTSLEFRLINRTIGNPVYMRASSGNAYNALDLNRTTVWTPSGTESIPYLEFDFVDNVYLDGISISESEKNITSWKLQVYNGKGWIDAYTGGTIANSGNINFERIAAQKARLVINSSDGKPTISEISITPINKTTLLSEHITAVEELTVSKIKNLSGTTATFNEICEVGKIQIMTDEPNNTFTYQYFDDTSSAWKEINNADLDFQKTEDGLFVQLYKTINTSGIKVIASANVNKFEVWGVLPKEEQTEEVLFTESFEISKGSFGTWASATTESTSDAAYEGEKSLRIANRNAPWSAATLNLGTLLGTSDTTTEYTLSGYAKTGSGTTPFIIYRCDSGGVDDSDSKSDAVEINSSVWTYFEYKFTMNAKYPTYKFQTPPPQGSVGDKLDIYLDAVKITRPMQECTCNPSSPVIENDEIINIAVGGSRTVPLVSSMQKSVCLISDHNTSTTTYEYIIVDDKSNIADIDGNYLTVTGEGTVSVKVKASINGLTRFTTKEFSVEESDTPSDTYKDWATTENGAKIDKIKKYVIVSFNGYKTIDTIVTTGNVKATTYWDTTTNAWVPVPASLSTKPIVMPAIRIEANAEADVSGITVEANGEPFTTTTDICFVDAPEILNNANILLGAGETEATITLDSYVFAYNNGCTVSGHATATPTVIYTVVSNTTQSASISGNVLSVQGAGKVTVRLTVALNGITKTTEKNFDVAEGGRKNFAASVNGGKATVNKSGEGSIGAIIDGDNSHLNSQRWRINGETPFDVEIEFDKIRSIDTISLFSQQDEEVTGPYKIPDRDMETKFALKEFDISYWDGNEWVLLPNGQVTNNLKVWYEFKLATAIETSKIKFTIKHAGADIYARIIEIEAWGSYDPAEDEVSIVGESIVLDLSKASGGVDPNNTEGTTAPTPSYENGKVTCNYTQNNTRLFIQLTEQQKNLMIKAKEKGYKLSIEIRGESTNTTATYRCYLSSIANSNWDGTAASSLGETNFNAFITNAFTAGFSTRDSATLEYFMMQIRSNVPATITIESITITVIEP